MTISSNYVPVKSSGNGVTTAFSGNWQIIAQGYERVYLQDKTTGIQTLQTIGTDYTLVFDESGFTVTFVTPPPSTVYVVIGRDVEESQNVPFKVSTGFDGKVQENAFDKVTAMAQDTQEQVNRCMVFPLGSSLTGLMKDAPQDGYGVVWDGTSGEMRNTDASLAVLEGNAATVAGISSDVTTVAGIAANVTTVAMNAAAVTTCAGSIANINAAPAAAATASAAAAAATAAAAALANEWLFSTSTTMASPGVGNFRLNNATFASVTQIAIAAQSGDAGNPNLRTFIQTWDDGTHNPRGILRIEKNPTNFIILGINGALTDNTSWLQIPVTYIAGAGSFSLNDPLFIQFTPYGNDGSITSVGVSMPAEFAVANSPVTTNGTINITKNTQAANTVWAGPVSGGAAQPTFRALVGADLPGKTIKQIVQVTKTDTFTTSSNTLTDVTGLSLSITPTSASSQILLMAMVSVGLTTGVTDAFLALANGSGPLLEGGAAGSRTVCTAACYPSHQNAIDTTSMMYVDSPGSTSAQTYKVQIAAASGTASINASGLDTNSAGIGRAASSLIAIEIG